MPEREEPDIDEVREALREHDERSEENAAQEERERERREGGDDDAASGRDVVSDPDVSSDGDDDAS